MHFSLCMKCGGSRIMESLCEVVILGLNIVWINFDNRQSFPSVCLRQTCGQIVTMGPNENGAASLHILHCHGGNANSIQCVFIKHMPSTLVGARRYTCCCFLDSCSWFSPKPQTAYVSKLQLHLSTTPILLPLVFLISLNDSSNHLVLKPEPRAYS